MPNIHLRVLAMFAVLFACCFAAADDKIPEETRERIITRLRTDYAKKLKSIDAALRNAKLRADRYENNFRIDKAAGTDVDDLNATMVFRSEADRKEHIKKQKEIVADCEKKLKTITDNPLNYFDTDATNNPTIYKSAGQWGRALIEKGILKRQDADSSTVEVVYKFSNANPEVITYIVDRKIDGKVGKSVDFAGFYYVQSSEKKDGAVSVKLTTIAVKPEELKP